MSPSKQSFHERSESKLRPNLYFESLYKIENKPVMTLLEKYRKQF